MPPRTKRATPTPVRQAKQRVTRARHRYQRSRTRKNGRAFRSALGALVALVGLGAAMAFVTKPRQVRNTHSPPTNAHAGANAGPRAMHKGTTESSLKDHERLIQRMKDKLPNALKEMEEVKANRKEQKTGHWAWWAFPTELKGGYEPKPRTCVTEPTAAYVIANAPQEWEQTLKCVRVCED